jgi:hypothetical protein
MSIPNRVTYPTKLTMAYALTAAKFWILSFLLTGFIFKAFAHSQSDYELSLEVRK